MEVFTNLTHSSNPVIAILSGLVIVLSSVVIYQWKYATDKTVPKWIYDGLVGVLTEMKEAQKEQTIIIRERLGK